MICIKNLSLSIDEKLILNSINVSFGKGLNFIVGESGSGKSTLLNVITGFEKRYDGQVILDEKDIRDYSVDEYNNILNFNIALVSQENNLLDSLTVMENIKLAKAINPNIDDKQIEELFKKFNMLKHQDKLVKVLSGGQKQKVSLIKALAKNSDILIIDEPTSAVDEGSTKKILTTIMELALDKVIIVVTHDKKLITNKANVFEMRSGKLTVLKNESSEDFKLETKASSLGFKQSFKLQLTYARRNWFKYIIPTLTSLLAIIMLVLACSGSITRVQNQAYRKLEKDYGFGLKNISIVSEFTEAAGGGSSGGNATKQDIKGIYERYYQDQRVETIIYMQSLNGGYIPGGYRGPKITIEGTKVNDFQVEGSNSVPYFNSLYAGEYVNNEEREVLISLALLNRLKLNPEDVIGKKISFDTKNLGDFSDVIISGIADSSVKVGGLWREFEDSFILSRRLVKEQAEKGDKKYDFEQRSFYIRCNTLPDVVDIANELKAVDIIPLGTFTKVEDIIQMNRSTNSLGVVMTIVIVVLAVGLVVGLNTLAMLSRKKDLAILKTMGYKNKFILKLFMVEGVILAGMSAILYFAVSPILNLTADFFYLNVYSFLIILLALGLILAISALVVGINYFLSKKINIVAELRE